MATNRQFTQEELAAIEAEADIIVNAICVRERFAAITKARKAATTAILPKKNTQPDYILEAANLAGVSKERLLEARAAVQHLKTLPEIPYRSEPCDWAILVAFLEAEESRDAKHIHTYLERCDTSVKKQEINMLLVELENYLIKNPNKKETKIYQDINAYCIQVRKDKDVIPVERLSDLTIAASRVLFMARNPNHINNDHREGLNIFRGLNKGKEICRQSWGKILGGLFLTIILFTSMVGVPLWKTGCQEKNLANHMQRLFSPQKPEKIKVATTVAAPPLCRMGSRQPSR